MNRNSVAIVILAGGEARRFPGKLQRLVRGTPLVVTVYRNLRGRFPVYVSTRGVMAADLRDLLHAPIIVDRWAEYGPLGGLATAADALGYERLFIAAGDAPAVTGAVLETLLAAWKSGDEAAVPEHSGRLEPLAALYDRMALLRKAKKAMALQNYALHALLDRMKVRRVPLPDEYFVNVNTEADLARIGED